MVTTGCVHQSTTCEECRSRRDDIIIDELRKFIKQRNFQEDENRMVRSRLNELNDRLLHIENKFYSCGSHKEKNKQLNFEESFKELMKGKKIHRNSNFGNVIEKKYGHKLFSANDIIALDWEVIE